MLARLGSFIVRRRGTTLLGVLLLTVAAAVFGGGVARNLIAGGFEPAGAESVRCRGGPRGVVRPGPAERRPRRHRRRWRRRQQRTRAAGMEVTEFVAGFEHVDLAVSYWSLGDPPPLRGADGDNALVMAHVEGTETEAIERADELVEAIERERRRGERCHRPRRRAGGRQCRGDPHHRATICSPPR